MPDLFISPDNNQTPPEQAAPTANDSQPQSSPPINPTPTSMFLTPPHKIGMFATYGEIPMNIHFGTQEPNEKIFLFLRRDFITNLPWIVSSIVLTLAPIFFTVLANLSNIQISAIPIKFSTILLLFYYIIVVTYALVNFITWYFNVSLITSERVMDIDFEDIIYKNVAETKLNLVQDVSYKQVGAIRTFFDFGDVLIQTAAAVDTFELSSVPRPQKVVEVVQKLIGRGNIV